jgi:uncharacterized membrane protein
LEIKLEAMLDLQLQNGKHDPLPTFTILQQTLHVLLALIDESKFAIFFLFSSNYFKFFHQALIVRSNLLQCVKIGRVKKKQLFTIDIMPI